MNHGKLPQIPLLMQTLLYEFQCSLNNALYNLLILISLLTYGHWERNVIIMFSWQIISEKYYFLGDLCNKFETFECVASRASFRWGSQTLATNLKKLICSTSWIKQNQQSSKKPEKFHIRQRHDLYYSVNITRLATSRIRWLRHVARVNRWHMFTKFWLESPIYKDHLQDVGIDGTIILKIDLKAIGCEIVD